jgi:flagellar biosynthesis/type III secretory pathway protein FliH
MSYYDNDYREYNDDTVHNMWVDYTHDIYTDNPQACDEDEEVDEYDEGYDDGYTEGYNAGYNQGFSYGSDVGFKSGYKCAFNEKLRPKKKGLIGRMLDLFRKP